MRIQILILGFKGLKIILISQACHNMRGETLFFLSFFFLYTFQAEAAGPEMRLSLEARP